MAYLTNKASKLIKRHGVQGVILKYVGVTTEKSGDSRDNPRTEHPCFVFFSNSKLSLELFGGGFLSMAKNTVLLSVEGLDFEPKNTDKLRVGEFELRMKSIVRHAPAGETWFYEIEVDGW